MTLITRERYNTVAATLALVLAVGTSGAYAAGKITEKDIAEGAVTSKAVRNQTLTAADLKDGSVSTGKVKDGSLKRKDLAPGALPLVKTGRIGGGTPPASPVTAHAAVAIELARPTRLLVVTSVELDVQCIGSGTPCAFAFGTYVSSDGAPRVGVPGTGDVAGAASGVNVKRATTTYAVVDLAEGVHQLSFGIVKTSADGTVSLSKVHVTALEVGNPVGSAVS